MARDTPSKEARDISRDVQLPVRERPCFTVPSHDHSLAPIGFPKVATQQDYDKYDYDVQIQPVLKPHLKTASLSADISPSYMESFVTNHAGIVPYRRLLSVNAEGTGHEEQQARR